MAKHQVFVIHGMGSYNQDWSLDAQRTLNEAFGQYPGWRSLGTPPALPDAP